MKNVLFVCTGNTCRSPMAAALFQKFLKVQGIASLCSVESRGLMATEGEPASIEAQTAVKEMGVDLSAHHATPLTSKDLFEENYFVCMTASHAVLLKSFFPKANVLTLNISDPFGMSLEVYKQCAKEIEAFFPSVMEFVFGFSKIREMTKDDLEQVAEIEKKSFSVPWTIQGLQDGMESSTGVFLVADDHGKAIAYVGANQILDEVYLNNIAVLPDYRKQGIGRALMNALIFLSAHKNASFVSLEVRNSNSSAIALYEALGFQKQGERKDFYSNPTENALILTKYLK